MPQKSPRAAREALPAAEDIIRKVESLVVKEAPILAGTVQPALEQVRAEVLRLRSTVDDERQRREQLRQLYQDLERLHEQDERRLSEMEREQTRLKDALGRKGS